MARASARRSPPRTPATSSSSVSSRRTTPGLYAALRPAMRFGFATCFDLLEQSRDALERRRVLAVRALLDGCWRRMLMTVAERRDGRLRARFECVVLLLGRDRQPSRHDDCDRRRDEVHRARADPDS